MQLIIVGSKYLILGSFIYDKAFVLYNQKVFDE